MRHSANEDMTDAGTTLFVDLLLASTQVLFKTNEVVVVKALAGNLDKTLLKHIYTFGSNDLIKQCSAIFPPRVYFNLTNIIFSV